MGATAVFVAGEFALVAVDRTRIARAADEGDKRAGRVRGLLARLSFHLSGAQLGITITSLVLGFLAEPILAGLIAPLLEPLAGDAAHSTSVVVALILATFGLMVVGELVPKNVAIAKPDGTARLLAPILAVYGTVFGPVITLLDRAANATMRRLGIEPREELSTVRSLPELSLLIAESAEQGTIAAAASTLFSRSVRFTGKTAADVLVPRVDLDSIGRDDTVADLVALARTTGHSRFPVRGADLDDIVGVVHVKAAHSVAAAARAATPVHELMHDVVAVPETRRLEGLLLTMREAREHLAVVVDEHGGTAGIVTLEDLLEEIVGEIDDEYDVRTPGVARRSADGGWVLSGLVHPDEVTEVCGLVLPDGEYETLAGFVLDRLGHIPEVGERCAVDGWIATVSEMDRHRIASVTLRIDPDAMEGS